MVHQRKGSFRERFSPLPFARFSQFTGWTGDIAILAQPSASSTTATIASIDVEITANYSGEATGRGLLGRYYNNGAGAAYPVADAATGMLALTRTDAKVDSTGVEARRVFRSPQTIFLRSGTGRVKAPVSGTYTFTVTGDDGVRLFLNERRSLMAGGIRVRPLIHIPRH